MQLVRQFGRVTAFSLAASLLWGVAAFAQSGDYRQHNLVSDGFIPADHLNSDTVNAWGVAFNPTTFAWVANNGTNTASVFDGHGNGQLTVSMPADAPTGIVFNASEGFQVSSGGISGPSRFLFATESGFILGWAPNVSQDHALVAVDSSDRGAVYKGIALLGNGKDFHIYATDFHNSRIDVFDHNFQRTQLSGSFTDPNLPAGFGPFGIQALNGSLYVSYAKQDAEKHDDVKGQGLGVVDVFDPDGHLIKRLISGGPLNAPWGMAFAPANFGPLSGRLLVGNFGDGTIHAFDARTGDPVGTMTNENGQTLMIDGLWGIAFGNGVNDQPTNALFFAAGPDDENHGLFGRIDPVNPISG